MKLITVLMFSTLIWPSPFLAGRAKKIHAIATTHISAKLVHSKYDHSEFAQIAQITHI